MKRFTFSLLILLGCTDAGALETHSAKPLQTSLTVYRPGAASGRDLFDIHDPHAEAGGIALVSEIRDVELPEGESTLVFYDVAQTLVPQSARVDSLDGVITEANFDYSLISPGDIVAHSLGEQVTLVRTDAATGKVTEERAKLVSGPDGIVLDINGRVEALDCSGEHEKIIFHSIPAGLTATPHLSAKVRVQKAGKRQLQLRYLATGFDWRAQYIARVSPTDNYLHLTGWVTLVNQQTTSFLNSPVDVVAGDLSIDEDTVPVSLKTKAKSNACWYVRKTAAAAVMVRKSKSFANSDVEEIVLTGMRASVAEQRELGDYKLYRLPAPTDLLAQQIKQVKMLDEPKVAFEKIYFAQLDDDVFSNRENTDDVSVNGLPGVAATSSIRLQNKKAAGLGKPIPAGSIVVMADNLKDGSSLFVGEDNVMDTPVNLPVDIVLGEADNIAVHPSVERDYTQEKSDGDVSRSDRVVVVSNNKAEAITFEIRMAPDTLENYRIVKESVSHRFNEGSLVWTLNVPAGKQAKLAFTLEDTY